MVKLIFVEALGHLTKITCCFGAPSRVVSSAAKPEPEQGQNMTKIYSTQTIFDKLDDYNNIMEMQYYTKKIVSAIKFVLQIMCTCKCHSKIENIFMIMARLNIKQWHHIIKILE